MIDLSRLYIFILPSDRVTSVSFNFNKLIRWELDVLTVLNDIHKFTRTIVRGLQTPPWQSDIMEFRYGLWRGISPLFSESGRQLGEENTRPFIFNHHIPADVQICKYEGSRFDQLINISALRIAMKNFDEALAITDEVRTYHCKQKQVKNSDTQIGIWDLYIIARASIALIAFEVRRKKSISRAPIIRDDLSSLYQFISGVFMICRHMMNEADPKIFSNAPISAKELYAYADENKIFTSFNGMVCAGSTRKIIEFLEYCNHGSDQNSHKPGVEENEFLFLKSYIGEVDDWYNYALSAIELDCFLEMEYFKKKISLQKGDEISQKIFAIYQSLANYCCELSSQETFNRDRKDTSDFLTGTLLRQNKILTLLQRDCIQKISAKHLRERLDY